MSVLLTRPTGRAPSSGFGPSSGISNQIEANIRTGGPERTKNKRMEIASPEGKVPISTENTHRESLSSELTIYYILTCTQTFDAH
ncbi:hypothetical protein PGT21_003390 [Puccinia graminis f. sp. tritici]|uniref:Uncharacterized protein n=1 Tax=Puccinia graminis f. sp. tritici TaxID=56615 RepID=A0A5B0NM40_PUCGR|nr:hypothetical protein PGT21_003390 [Puccinia graminis f. sp. tritici]